MITEYRKLYNQAKSVLSQRHNAELHQIMAELGYTKKAKTIIVKEAKVEPTKKQK